MYCSSCGSELKQKLNYCNSCGANLIITKAPDTSKSLDKSIESIIWSIVGITLSVLGIMVAVMALMNGFGLSGEVAILFMALMFLTLLGIDGLLVWQLRRLNSRAKKAKDESELAKHDAKEFDNAREQMLLEPKMSVTENTTQPFEPVYEERRTK